MAHEHRKTILRFCCAVLLACLSATTVAGLARADVVISNDPTQNMSCSGGVCSPTTSNAVLNVTDLANMLAASDTAVTTGSSAVNIDIVTALGWSSSSHLTLDANTNLNIQAPVTVAGSGALTLTYNDGGSNGDLIFSNGGNATFASLGSGLIINGNGYALVPDLNTLGAAVKVNPSGFYALANSYDAMNYKPKKVPVETPLDGVFEGLGNTINNLSITHSASCNNEFGQHCLGVFASVSEAGVVRDILLQNLKLISTDADLVGGIIGQNWGSMINVLATGSVYGYGTDVGGLIGRDEGRIVNSGASASVTNTGNDPGFGDSVVGGLVGDADNASTIVHSWATGSVSSRAAHIGGLVGQSTGTVRLSFATGNVAASTDFAEAGGFAGALGGVLGGTTDQCWASGSVTVTNITSQLSDIGGFAGGAGSVSNSYSTGTVTAPHGYVVGGFAGYNSNFETSYTVSMVKTKGSQVGGFIGRPFPPRHKNYSDYWDTNTTKQTEGCGKGNCRDIVGLTDAQLKSGLPAGFDPHVWSQNPSINNGYPYLLANPPQSLPQRPLRQY